ncbi:MAG: SMC-Scp complex subunit ScpB [Parcubacteria group bacterium]|nr:SMC-Scp complex subunit ScpB [Parcubacteria group bacterium]
MTDLAVRIEAILFHSGESLSLSQIAHIAESGEEEAHTALVHLEETLKNRGIRLVRHDRAFQLAVAPEQSGTITRLAKEELEAKLTRAAVETLAVIMYRNPVSKSEIDYIRGVNSAMILRNLMMRGLMDREPHPVDRRAFIYKPSLDLLRFLGVANQEELPDYTQTRKLLGDFLKQQEGEGQVVEDKEQAGTHQ